MADNSLPVVVRCGSVSVAIPIEILIKESTVFRAKYVSLENRIDSASEVEEMISKTESLNLAKNNPSTVTCTNCDSKVPMPTTHQSVDLIDLNNLCGESVKILFEYLAGYKYLLETCSNLQHFAGILQVCVEYEINRPIPEIISRLETYGLITMANLVDAYEMADNLVGDIDGQEEIAERIRERCIMLARCNLTHKLDIIHFILDNKDKIESVLEILKIIRDEPKATIRYKFDGVSEVVDKGRNLCHKFIINNVEWSLEVVLNYGRLAYEVGLSPRCGVYCKSWSCEANLNVKIYSGEENCVVREDEDSEKFRSGWWFHRTFAGEESTQKDEMIYEAKVLVTSFEDNSTKPSEVKSCWFDSSQKVSCTWLYNLVASNRKSESGDDDFDPVFLNSGGKILTAKKSVLVKESPVFKTMLSQKWNGGACNCDHTAGGAKFRRIREIEIPDSYDLKAVQILNEFLHGKSSLLTECTDLSTLADVALLCDYFDIQRPLPEILSKIMAKPVDLQKAMDIFKLADVFNGHAVEQNGVNWSKLLQDQALESINHARVAFTDWSDVMEYMVKYEDRIGAAVGLLQALMAPHKPVTIRFKIDTDCDNKDLGSWFTPGAKSPTFMGGNIAWALKFFKKEWKVEVGCFGLTNWEDPKVSAEVGAHVYKESDWSKHTYTTQTTVEFTRKCSTVRLESFMDKAGLKSSGFVNKYGYLFLEVVIRVVKVEGITDYTIGITEDKLAP